MPYQNLKYDHIQHPTLHKVLEHSDAMLHDLYTIFETPSKAGGAGNYSIAVVLLCIVDGLSCYLYPTYLYPTKTLERCQDSRFKKLIRDKLRWGQAKKEKMDGAGIGG